MNNPMNYDPASLPAFITMGPLMYDPNEIEHQFYMFDHRCVGCITLMCGQPLDTGVMGNVTISGKPISNCFWISLSLPEIGDRMLLGIPVRGHVEYGKSYDLALDGFKLLDETDVDPIDVTLKTKPRPVKDSAYAEHDAVALQAAREGMVFLQNDGKILPLAVGSTLNLFGEGVTNYRIAATGAGRINPRFCYDLRDAIKETSQFRLNRELDNLYRAN